MSSTSSAHHVNMPAGADDPTRRACDQCRQRKVRCDKDNPCSNCRTARRTCTSIGLEKRKEPRARVLISSQYERKIDRIDARLANIETLLKELTTRTAFADSVRPATHTPQSVHESSNPANASTVDFDSDDDNSTFADEPTLAAQRTFASEFLERAVEKTSLNDVNPAMREALSNLRRLVKMQNSQSTQQHARFPLQQSVPAGGLSELAMPPIDTVVATLKRIRDAPPCYFTFICYYTGISDFSSLCRVVYFPSDDFSDAIFTMVNVGLYYMFLEQHALASDPVEKQRYESYFQMARVNLETSLSNLSLFMSAKIDNVRALLLGVIYTIDYGRAAVAWTLNSTAAQLCQTGGFHRHNSSPGDKTNSSIKAALFLQVYTMDKALALRLGRAAAIQDWDITVPREYHLEGLTDTDAKNVPSEWLKLATLQGQIYEHLYSTSAVARPQSELVERACLLVDKCRRIEREASETRERAVAFLEKMHVSPVVGIHVKGDEVQLLCTLTLVYRAIPAPEGSLSRFCDQCIDTARRAMRKHQECMDAFDSVPFVKMIYIHWNLLLLPFSPFFVLFCYVIETSSHEDMQLLHEFTTTLGRSCFTSETAEKLWRLCNVMYSVAALYVEAKSQQQEDQTMAPIGDEFDMYLNQLGFMPMEDQAMMAQTETGGFAQANIQGNAQGNVQAAQIFDWFSGSRNLMGLLEEDLSQFGSQPWPPPSPM